VTNQKHARAISTQNTDAKLHDTRPMSEQEDTGSIFDLHRSWNGHHSCGGQNCVCLFRICPIGLWAKRFICSCYSTQKCPQVRYLRVRQQCRTHVNRRRDSWRLPRSALWYHICTYIRIANQRTRYMDTYIIWMVFICRISEEIASGLNR